MNRQDKEYLQAQIEKQKVQSPAGPSPESIVSLVTGQTQKKAKKKKIVPIVASFAAVFVIAVGLLFAMRGLANVRVIRNTHPGETAQPSEVPAQEAPRQEDYAALAGVLAKAVKERPYAYGYRGLYFNGWIEKSASFEDGDLAVNESPAPTAQESYDLSGAPASDGDHSELNTRTEGVDEADEFRTDGKYIYVLTNRSNGYRGWFMWGDVYAYGGKTGEAQRFIVVDPAGGKMQTLGEYALSLNAENASEITRERSFTGFYLYNGYAVLTGTEMRVTEGKLSYNEEYGYWDFTGDQKVEYLTLVLVLDLSDPADPKPVKELYFDGNLLDTRIMDSRLVTVTRFFPDAETFNEADYKTFVPRAGADGAYLPMDRIHIANDTSNAYTTVSVTALSGGFETNACAVLGGAEGLYVSDKNVYCYGAWYEEKGNDRYEEYFCVSKVDVTGLTPVYKATGKYKGIQLFDSYAIDEFEGRLRMAVESTGFWDSFNSWIPGKNYIVIADENLNVLGQSKSFGENENIRSVRFTGNTAYVVTFLNTDPLFVFDLSDPANPVAKGETKLPGFSAYLHPAGEGYMLGVGYDGTEEGITDAGKISLFDVTDPENPKEVDRLILESGYFDTDYKRFITKGENGYIVTFSQWNDTATGETAGAVYFTVENGKIVLKSKTLIPAEPVSARALFIGNTLYCFTLRYDRKEVTHSDGLIYEESSGPIWELYSFDLSSGGMIAKLAL